MLGAVHCSEVLVARCHRAVQQHCKLIHQVMHSKRARGCIHVDDALAMQLMQSSAREGLCCGGVKYKKSVLKLGVGCVPVLDPAAHAQDSGQTTRHTHRSKHSALYKSLVTHARAHASTYTPYPSPPHTPANTALCSLDNLSIDDSKHHIKSLLKLPTSPIMSLKSSPPTAAPALALIFSMMAREGSLATAKQVSGGDY